VKRTIVVTVSAWAVLALSVQCSSAPAVSVLKTSPSATRSHPKIRSSPVPIVRFTVSGSHPVPPNSSQDTYANTYAHTPAVGCDPATLTADKAVGDSIATGFSVAGFSAATALLSHFLSGQGTGVNYPAGSPIAKAAAASGGFRAVNTRVQDVIGARLRAGHRHIRLGPQQLPTVAFDSTGTDLFWAFRGTQGLTVTGSGSLAHGRYLGKLRYVIRDSYGFSLADQLAHIGLQMRYLQTVCGAPQHAGGARWFPDTITVTVPFSQPA
jgi:hypothetical protein